MEKEGCIDIYLNTSIQMESNKLYTMRCTVFGKENFNDDFFKHHTWNKVVVIGRKQS